MSKEIQTFSAFLAVNKDMLRTQIAAALPKHMNADRMIRILTTEMKKTPDLNKCTLQSILRSIMQASQLGLEVSSLIGHGYLVPFNKKDKASGKFVKECQFIIGYRGMIDLARRSGQLVSLNAQAVYENDHFDFKYGLEEKLDHIPHQGDRGGFICAYAIAKLKDGSYQFGVMFKKEIDAIRSRSKAGDFGPWETDYPEMAKKTVIRNIFKYLPISIEIYENLVKEEIREIKDISSNFSGSLAGDVAGTQAADMLSEFQSEEEPTLLPQTKSAELASKIEQSYKEDKGVEKTTQQ